MPSVWSSANTKSYIGKGSMDEYDDSDRSYSDDSKKTNNIRISKRTNQDYTYTKKSDYNQLDFKKQTNGNNAYLYPVNANKPQSINRSGFLHE